MSKKSTCRRLDEFGIKQIPTLGLPEKLKKKCRHRYDDLQISYGFKEILVMKQCTRCQKTRSVKL